MIFTTCERGMLPDLIRLGVNGDDASLELHVGRSNSS